MRNRRGRFQFDDEKQTKKILFIASAVVVLALIVFFITYIIYNNVFSNKTDSIDLGKITKDYSNINETISETSSQLGKSINEVEKENNSQEEKIAINTSKIVENKNNEEKVAKEKTKKTNVEDKPKEEKKQDPTFVKPVDGEIMKEFAQDNLVYSETLKEWITHNGIDIKADKTTIVKASSDGIIKSIKNDPRFGITVIIEHNNGYETIYSNLLTAEFVKEQEEVKQGQTIGTVGNTAMFEIADESHLHFEILKDNQYLNPSEYIR